MTGGDCTSLGCTRMNDMCIGYHCPHCNDPCGSHGHDCQPGRNAREKAAKGSGVLNDPMFKLAASLRGVVIREDVD